MDRARPEILCHTRPLLRKDLPLVTALDRACFAPREGETSLLRPLALEEWQGLVKLATPAGEGKPFARVAEHRGRVVGVSIVEPRPDHLQLVRLAVDAAYRYPVSEAAALLVCELTALIADGKYQAVTAEVPETHLHAQLFLRRRGFRCSAILEPTKAHPTIRYRFQYDRIAVRLRGHWPK